MATRAVAAAAVRGAAGAARAAAAPAGGLVIPTGGCQASAAATAASAVAPTGGGWRWWPAPGAPGGRAGLASAAGMPSTPIPTPSHPSPSTPTRGASPAADADAAAATAPGDADPQAMSLRSAIQATADTLMQAGWTNTEEDVDELLAVVEEGDATLDAYRPLYAAGAGAATHPATYAAFETFHRTKQALELTLLFEATTTRLMREHMDMTGVLGSNTAVPPDAAATLNRALNDYIDFVRAIADSPTDALRAKVEAELGAKVLQLRAVPSVGDSETRRSVPVAGDHILTDHVTTSVMDVSGRRARRAAAAAGQA